MRRLLLTWKSAALQRMLRGVGWTGWLAGVVLLALALSLAAGQARAAPRLPATSAWLHFTQPNYRGLIGGPPGTRVTLAGSLWMAYANVSLRLTRTPRSCAGAVSVGTYPTNGSGSFSARFNWPSAANALAPYYACATQANKSTAFSSNTFTVLASSAPSVSFSASTVTAGSSVTVTGHNWLPGQQTVTIVVLPCNTVCQAKPVADVEVVSGSDGTFSQAMTILAGATSGNYYAQAANTEATLSAISPPIQVAGQAAPGGTPLPGSSPTTSATRTTSGVGAAQPPSQVKPALKEALLAAVLGLVALLLLLGLVALAITRRRGAGPAAPKAGKDETLEDAPPAPVGRAIWRTTGAALPDVRADATEEMRQGLGVLPWRRGEQTMAESAERDTLNLPIPALPTASGSGDNYHWEQPTVPGNTLDVNPHTLSGSRANQSSTRGPDSGIGQWVITSPPPADEEEDE